MKKFNQDELEYLKILTERIKFLGRIIFNEPFLDYEPERRFYILKELYSIYSELYSMKVFKEVHSDTNAILLDFSAFQKDLIKMIRNVMLHFPFFNCWNEVWIKKSLVILNTTFSKANIPNSSIDRFFLNHQNKRFAVRLTEVSGKIIQLTLKVPEGYDNNDKIFLRDVIEEEHVGKFSVGYIRILLNNFLITHDLSTMIIPLVENFDD